MVERILTLPPKSQIPTFYYTLHNRWNCNCDRVYSYIRFCHIAQWTFRRELTLSGPHLIPLALRVCVHRSEPEDFRDWKQERDLCPISGLKLEGITGQGIWQHLGTQSGPRPTTSKDIKTSVIKSLGAEFCQGKNELRIIFFSRASRTLSPLNIPWFQLCDTPSRGFS